MRTKETLFAFENIQTLLQYPYMDPDHCVKVDNDVTTLQIRMEEDGRFFARNLLFPDHPELNYTQEMTVPAMLSIIEQLKGKAPEQFPHAFQNRWEEIDSMTSMNLSLNKFNQR